MAGSIIAHPTRKEKTTTCSCCKRKFPRCGLREVGPEEASWSFTVCEGQAFCRSSCARRHRML